MSAPRPSDVRAARALARIVARRGGVVPAWVERLAGTALPSTAFPVSGSPSVAMLSEDDVLLVALACSRPDGEEFSGGDADRLQHLGDLIDPLGNRWRRRERR